MHAPAHLHHLRRSLQRALERLDAASLAAEAARRAYFWGDRPSSETRAPFQAAMREEADAILALEATRRALLHGPSRLRHEPLHRRMHEDAPGETALTA